MSYGLLWETTLKKLWANPSLSLHEICKRVGLVQWGALRRQAIRLGLPTPRVGPRGLVGQWNPDYSAKPSNNHIPEPQALIVYRREWIEGMKKNPELLTTRELIQDNVLALIYRRLLKYDREWLSINSPTNNRAASINSALASRRKSYWEQLDTQLEHIIEHAAQQLKEKPGRSVRVSRSAIARELGFKSQVIRQLKKLPKTDDTLTKLIESGLDFALRRIRRAAVYFREEGIIPTRTQLLHKACVGTFYWKVDVIRKLAEEVLNDLGGYTAPL